MITFHVRPHRILPDREVVEVCRDGEILASLYAADRDGDRLRILSRHMGNVLRPEWFAVDISFKEPKA